MPLRRALLLFLPFAAYAIAATVPAYHPVVGSSFPKPEPLPPADDFARGRERCVKVSAGYHSLASTAFRIAPEKPADPPDDARKIAAGVLERNLILDDLRAFGLRERPAYHSSLKAEFLAAR